ncbi:MAG: hypothetical protein ABI361_08360 [Nitrososphaera sp.]|jgi:hypothetical protein
MSGKSAESTVKVQRHEASISSEALNHSTERVMREADFLDAAMGLLRGLSLPAFRAEIIDHIRSNSKDLEYIALFETLDHYIRYDDEEQIRAAFEVNLPYGQHHATPWRRDEAGAIKTTPTT